MIRFTGKHACAICKSMMDLDDPLQANGIGYFMGGGGDFAHIRCVDELARSKRKCAHCGKSPVSGTAMVVTRSGKLETCGSNECFLALLKRDDVCSIGELEDILKKAAEDALGALAREKLN